MDCVAGCDAPFRPEAGKPAGAMDGHELKTCNPMDCVAGCDAPFRPEAGKPAGAMDGPAGVSSVR
jgi:hypothetical protein